MIVIAQTGAAVTSSAPSNGNGIGFAPIYSYTTLPAPSRSSASPVGADTGWLAAVRQLSGYLSLLAAPNSTGSCATPNPALDSVDAYLKLVVQHPNASDGYWLA